MEIFWVYLIVSLLTFLYMRFTPDPDGYSEFESNLMDATLAIAWPITFMILIYYVVRKDK